MTFQEIVREVRTLSLDEKRTLMHFLTDIFVEQSESRDFVQHLPEPPQRDWELIDSLFGVWADADMSDDWIDELRRGWDERLHSIYESDGE